MFRVVLQPSVQKSIDHYIEEWIRGFHDFQEEWGVGNSTDKTLGEHTAGLMRKNFRTKLDTLADTKKIKVYSIERNPVKQAIIPSHGIYLFLTYEEDEGEKVRYITYIEILRK